jgi:peroxiredoxin
MDVVLLGVSKDSLKSHDKFIRDFGLSFVLLSDPDAKMMQDYGAFGEKVMYGKKTMGTIRSTVGADGMVIKHWQSVVLSRISVGCGGFFRRDKAVNPGRCLISGRQLNR